MTTESIIAVTLAAFVLLILSLSLFGRMMMQRWMTKHRIMLRQYVDRRVDETICEHEKRCRATLPMNYDKPQTRHESFTMLSGFMMTYYPRFMVELKASLASPLSKSEERLCMLTKMGLSNPALARTLIVSQPTLSKMRMRIRNKIAHRDPTLSFEEWIRRMGEPLDTLPPSYILSSEEEEKLAAGRQAKNPLDM